MQLLPTYSGRQWHTVTDIFTLQSCAPLKLQEPGGHAIMFSHLSPEYHNSQLQLPFTIHVPPFKQLELSELSEIGNNEITLWLVTDVYSGESMYWITGGWGKTAALACQLSTAWTKDCETHPKQCALIIKIGILFNFFLILSNNGLQFVFYHWSHRIYQLWKPTIFPLK